MNKAIFLDRDGTINVEKHYLHRIEEFEFLPGAVEALRMAQNAGFRLIVITNQSGIARGYYRDEDFQALNSWMLKTLESDGVHIDGVYYCPHHPEARIPQYRMDCDCRKPKLGMFRRAIEDFDLNVDACCAIGDKIRDCSICETTGCRGFLVGNNEDPETIEQVRAGKYRNVMYEDSLLKAVERIISQPCVRNPDNSAR